MKLTRCDKCGKEADGRNPEGFGEVLIDHKYYDLCEDCKKKVDSIIYTFDLKKRLSLQNYINTPPYIESATLENAIEKTVKRAENTIKKMVKQAENCVETRQDDGKNE